MRVNFKPDGLTGVVLGAAAVIGVCSIATLMPGIAYLVPKRRDLPPYQPAAKYKLVRQALRRLEKRGLVKGFTKDDGTECVYVTQRGHEELLRFQLLVSGLKQPKIWDMRWRLVIFDIKEIHKSLRERIRCLLRHLGFVRLQDSVWIYPFPCEEAFELIKTAFNLKREAMYLTCDRFFNDRWLCKEFELSAKSTRLPASLNLL